ncbi:class II aldolase/adducin family protein [Methylocella sp.]|uniref:class II aldolase/adducin family protein n=1 Tax=Methylocella sp. TaxID=1978226 RepID=UPI00378514F4
MSEPGEFALRQSVVSACREMNASGLNQGTAGNISVRFSGGLIVTPSGVPYDAMTPDDLVFMGFDGSYSHRLAPSSEWRLHRDVLEARAEFSAVVHAHPIYCTAFAMCRREIPAAHYMIAAAGGATIRCADYETFGTPELSAAALKAMEGRACALMANHGLVAAGPDLARAMWLALEVETLARQYAAALQIGRPVLLDDAEIERNVEKFKSYGLRRRQEPGQGPEG